MKPPEWLLSTACRVLLPSDKVSSAMAKFTTCTDCPGAKVRVWLVMAVYSPVVKVPVLALMTTVSVTPAFQSAATHGECHKTLALVGGGCAIGAASGQDLHFETASVKATLAELVTKVPAEGSEMTMTLNPPVLLECCPAAQAH